MKKLVIMSLLVMSVAGCSGMGGMLSGSSGTSSFSGSSGQYSSDSQGNWNSMTTPVINQRTGQLNLYHGG